LKQRIPDRLGFPKEGRSYRPWQPDTVTGSRRLADRTCLPLTPNDEPGPPEWIAPLREGMPRSTDA